MYLKKISLRAVRNYKALDLDLGPGLNLFHGDNAQGKTNLLEAVHILGSLRSFRGVKAQSVISWEEKSARISGRMVTGAGAKGHTQAHELRVDLEKAGRRPWLDGKKPDSSARYLLALRVISFSPEDLFLVKEYPSSRRRFLDRSIFHATPGYLDMATRYGAAVRQLNAALKARDVKVVASYEEVLAPLAADVGFRRRARAEDLMPVAAELFDKVLGAGSLGLLYKSHAKGRDKTELEVCYRAILEKKRQDSLKRGHCLAGPHTDDLALTISGRELKATASRGQSRLALLALVLADAQLYREQSGEQPVLLLDDAVSELDDRRKEALLEYVSGLGQVLFTSTDKTLLKGKGSSFKVTADPEGWANIKA